MKVTLKRSLVQVIMFVSAFVSTILIPLAGMSQPGPTNPGDTDTPAGNPVVPFDPKMTIIFLLVAVVFAVFTIKRMQQQKVAKKA